MGASSSHRSSQDEVIALDLDPNLKIPELSDVEKDLIRTSWKILDPQASELGCKIFEKIFELRPDVKRFFPFRDEVGEALVKNSHFKGHSMRFINAIRMSVSNMDAWELILIPNLLRLGHHHTTIPGFSHDIFEIFYYAMNDVLSVFLGKSYTGELKAAWCKVFVFIISNVEEGYKEGTTSNNHVQTSSARVHNNTTEHVS